MTQPYARQQFRSSPTVAVRGTTLDTGVGTWFSSLGWMVGGILLFAIPVIGPVIGSLCLLRFLWLSLKSAWIAVAGVPDHIAQGNCPHCETEVSIMNEEGTTKSCPTCKHRLTLRGGHLVDVTG